MLTYLDVPAAGRGERGSEWSASRSIPARLQELEDAFDELVLERPRLGTVARRWRAAGGPLREAPAADSGTSTGIGCRT